MFTVSGPDLTASQLHDLLRLRVDIFVVEQDCPYPEIDGRDLDAGTTHLWLPGPTRDVPVAAALRILTDETEKRVGRVVTHIDHRGQGHSSTLMEAALGLVGSQQVVLDAQAHLTDFYARFGFEADSPEFLEDGIPHVTMRRSADQSAKNEPHPQPEGITS